MQKNFFFSIVICSFIILALPLSAKDKDRVAVLDFNAHNCPQSLAKVISDMVGAKVFETHIFTIVERGQIDQVFKELELQQTGCTDSECAVEVGKMLSANKIVIGTVHKVDRYIVILKIVNVADNHIEGNYRVEAIDESEFEDAIQEVIEKMKYDFKTDSFLSYSISAGFLYAMGDFEDVAEYGYGINLNANINNFLFRSAILTLSAGFYSFTGADDSIDSIMIIPVSLYFGYSFNISRKFKIVPSIGGGYLVNMMSYDKDNADQVGNYNYSREIFYDPTASVRCDIDYAALPYLYISLSPQYTFLFEKKKTGQMLGANLGVKLFL